MRYLSSLIVKDLDVKMVFLGGPRQVGKTTLALNILQKTYQEKGIYLNWDDPEHKKRIIKRDWIDSQQLIILDELHKYKLWRNFIKGTFDTQKNHKFLVTGSARLDLYRRGGDSLVGRYHYWRLHPFTIDEIPNGIDFDEGVKRLMQVGGFPEPFLNGDPTFGRRWQRQRIDRVIREDIIDLESIKQIGDLSLFLELLRSRVGSLVAVSSIAQDVGISPSTAARWLTILESMYLLFVIHPFSGKIARALKKTPKIYFYDNQDVEGDEGSIFENLIATTLLKRIQFLEDSQGYGYELRYLRDKEQREVDFLVVKNRKPILMIEAKLRDSQISKSLSYFAAKFPDIKVVQVVKELTSSYFHKNITVTDLKGFIPFLDSL